MRNIFLTPSQRYNPHYQTTPTLMTLPIAFCKVLSCVPSARRIAIYTDNLITEHKAILAATSGMEARPSGIWIHFNTGSCSSLEPLKPGTRLLLHYAGGADTRSPRDMTAHLPP